MGYKWAQEFCPQANFVLKTDDDVFVDTFGLINLVDSLVNHDKIIVGRVNYETPPQRKVGDKWFVRMDEYSLDVYPDYCIGMGFLMSFDVVQLLLKASEGVEYFWVEDVFVTGILREYVQNEFGIVVDMYPLNNKYTFTDGLDDSFTLWLYSEKCHEEDFPWIFVHCWEKDVFVHFDKLWKFLLGLNNKT